MPAAHPFTHVSPGAWLRTLSGRFGGRFAAAAALCVLAACASTPEATVQWARFPSYPGTAPGGATIFVTWRDTSATPELDFASALRQAAAQKGLEIVEQEADATYLCFASLRYFGENPAGDRGASVLKAAGDVAGGYQGWMLEEQGGLDMEVPPIEAVQVDGARPGFFKQTFTATEWNLLIDFAVGEKRSGGKPEYARREGRLHAYTSGRAMNREEAIAALKGRVEGVLRDALPPTGGAAAPAP